MKRAFTLIELLVVIGIIAVLAAILLASFGSSTESARAAKCMSNLKNLANACQSYGAAIRHYPNAGSVQYLTIDESRGIRNAHPRYFETPGWICWLSDGKFPSSSPVSPSTQGFISSGDTINENYAITNGAIFKYVGGNRETYVCPCHIQQSGKAGRPLWSYLMNAYFKWDCSEGYAYLNDGHGLGYGSLKKADRILLFGEIPFRKGSPGEWRPTGEGTGMDDDAILQYRGCDKAPGIGGKSPRDGNEMIGGNHPIGRPNSPRGWLAHVVFADAHVEKINVTGLNDENLRKLTTYLCTGVDYAIEGENVNEMK